MGLLSTHLTLPADSALSPVLPVSSACAINANPEREIDTQTILKRASRNRAALDQARTTRDESTPDDQTGTRNSLDEQQTAAAILRLTGPTRQRPPDP